MGVYIRFVNFWPGFYTNKDDVDRIIKSAIRDTFQKHSMDTIEDMTKPPHIIVSSVFGNPRTLEYSYIWSGQLRFVDRSPRRV